MKRFGSSALSKLKTGAGYASQAAPRTSTAASSIQVSKTPNGALVASIDGSSPASRIAFCFNAGSRHETPENEGLAHVMRNVSAAATNSDSAFGLTRKVQQIGANITCTTGRETLTYAMECQRSLLPGALDFLSNVAFKRTFKPWEVVDREVCLQEDLARLSYHPEVQLYEMLHKAAYRRGLGNSLYIPQHRIGKTQWNELQAFAEKFCTSDNVAVVGTNVDHDFLAQFVQGVATTRGSPDTAKSVYGGGELRMDTSNPVVHAALATEGAGIGSKDLLPLGVLRYAMGGPAAVAYGSTNSRIAKAAAAATQGPHAAAAINLSYTDTGLFGFHVTGMAADMGAILKGVSGAFSAATKDGVSEADVARAKKQLAASILMAAEESEGLMEDMAQQLLFADSVVEPETLVAAIDKVTAAEVNTVAKKVINGKPTMVAIGNLSHTPYLDKLL